jgi:flagellar protein FlaG
MSEQVATVTPSPSAVAFEHAVTDKPAPPAQDATYVATAPPPPADPGKEVMKAVAAQIESYLKANGRDLQFSVDSETGQTIITVRDKSTGEVIRQIPNAEALRISQALGQQPNALIDVLI